MKKTFLVLAALMLASSAAFADTEYNNTSEINTQYGYFGYPYVATMGETFSAPLTDTTLNDFSLFLLASNSSGQLEGYVGTWTGSEVGTILYTSAPVTVTGANQTFNFNTGGLSLIPGDEYVAFISILEPNYNSYSGETYMPAVDVGTLIPGGSIAILRIGNDTSLFTSGNDWETTGISDVEFIADFSSGATPEPSSLFLFSTGLVGLAGVLRRKFAR
jgi:hypothetical protein